MSGTISPSEETMLAVVDRTGRQLRTITATRPWTPRISPDGRSVAYGAFGAGRSTSDLWVTDLTSGNTRRLTDDDGDGNDPQWSPDGKSIAYSASADGGKDLMVRPVEGGDARGGVQFPSDWLRDRSALLVTDNQGGNAHDILVQPADGSSPRPYVATSANETTARISPDGRWVAYTSDESGREEVYLDSYPTAGRRVALSTNGGVHPVWRGDGRELFYWSGEALMAVQLGPSSGATPPKVGTRTVLLHASYAGGINTMYDVSPDGQKFVIVANYRKGR
jgi:Tol biopolymer transport system component